MSAFDSSAFDVSLWRSLAAATAALYVVLTAGFAGIAARQLRVRRCAEPNGWRVSVDLLDVDLVIYAGIVGGSAAAAAGLVIWGGAL